MVRVLPSDLARLVLDYLHSEGLQGSHNAFLQESPHLQELRSNPSVDILPVGAKNLTAIVEEYYELMAQVHRQIKSSDYVLHQLWKKLDSLLAQIKHQYKQHFLRPPVQTACQAVRSRYSLNRLRHQQSLMERELAMQKVTVIASKQQNHPSKSSQDVSANQQAQDRSHDALESRILSPQPSVMPTAIKTSPAQAEPANKQLQFLTPDKSTARVERCLANEKVIGKSPKRKSVPPRRKAVACLSEKPRDTPTTSKEADSLVDIQDLPSPWGPVLNNMELMEKLAENINRVLPSQENPVQEMSREPSDHISISGGEESQHSNQTLEELLNGMMTENTIDEIVDMTSNDPTFNSLFSLFNTDRDKFLTSEREKLSQKSTEITDDQNASHKEGASSNTDDPSHLASELEQRTNLEIRTTQIDSTTGCHALKSGDGVAPVAVVPSGVVAATHVAESDSDERALQQSDSQIGEQECSTIDLTSIADDSTGVKSSAASDQFPNMIVTQYVPEEHSVIVSLDRRLKEFPVASAKPYNGCKTLPTEGIRKTKGGLVAAKLLTNMGVHVRTLDFGQVVDQHGKQNRAGVSKADGRRWSRVMLEGNNGRSRQPVEQVRTGKTAANWDVNERTPQKRQLMASRVYSPEENMVARMLTKLPTTPPKKMTFSPQRVRHSLARKGVIGSLKHQRSKERALLSRKAHALTASQLTSTKVLVNGVKSAELGGGTPVKIKMINGKKCDKTSSEGERTGVLKVRTVLNVPMDGAKDGAKDGTSSGKNVSDAVKEMADGEAGTTKKGVKRPKSTAEKNKAAKKSKRSKSKNCSHLDFPVNLNVDEFLSQIDYGT